MVQEVSLALLYANRPKNQSRNAGDVMVLYEGLTLNRNEEDFPVAGIGAIWSLLQHLMCIGEGGDRRGNPAPHVTPSRPGAF